MKKLLALMLAALMLFGATAVAELDGDAMFDYMVDEFLEIAKIPRGSSNTNAVSDYLKGWGEAHGFETMQDAVGNIRWDVPASEGYENAPLTILQAHMDMVVISDDGRDMTVSPITVVVDKENNRMSSDGHTSLGSDDGIGITTAMYLSTSQDYVHGPIRVIVTINEEGGSPSGTGNMDHAWVDGATYMVNIDSEDYATCTVAACGFAYYGQTVALESEAADAAKVAYTVDIHDTKGGHSGVDIDKNRANDIKAVNYCLAFAKYKGIDVQIASFTGGTGMTAIPAKANATVVFSAEYEDLFNEIVEEAMYYFAEQYSRTEAGYSFTCEKADLPETVLTVECTSKLVDLIAAVEEGVNTISQRYAGITETSLNLGTLAVDAAAESTTVGVSMRCSTQWPVMLANMQFQAISNAFGTQLMSWSMEPSSIGIGWVEKETDIIAHLYADAFKRYTGDDCVITAVHGGLECADFASWSDELEIISVGPTIESPHSVNEYVEIDTCWKTCGAIATLLNDIAVGVGE